MKRAPIFTVALLLALAIVTLWWQLSERRARHLARDLEQARQRLDRVADSLAAAQRDGSPRVTYQAEEITRLERQGLHDPLQTLKEELARHPELIGVKGTLGGTMFFDTTSIALIPDGRVSIGFEDGHVAGKGVFEYRIARDGRITWRKISAKLD